MNQEGGKQLHDEIMAFCRRYGLAKTQFGSMVVHSPSLVDSIARGRQLRDGTEAKIRDFMAAGDPRPSRRQSNVRAYMRAKARNIEAETAACQFRASDPVEQAKRVIRSRGFACFEAEITRPGSIGMYFIGAKLVTKAELFASARRHGWKSEGESE
jgi:hypothetical protein